MSVPGIVTSRKEATMGCFAGSGWRPERVKPLLIHFGRSILDSGRSAI